MNDHRTASPSESKSWSPDQVIAWGTQLVLAWLDGDLPESPWHLGPPDPETECIAGWLREFNQAGYVTTNSQPGDETICNDHSWVQRAWVAGAIASWRAVTIANACQAAGLMAVVWPASGTGEPFETMQRVNLTTCDGKATTWQPIGVPNDLVDWAGMPGDRLSELVVIDPAWGRNDRLWQTVASALATSVVHSSGGRLDTRTGGDGASKQSPGSDQSPVYLNCR